MNDLNETRHLNGFLNNCFFEFNVGAAASSSLSGQPIEANSEPIWFPRSWQQTALPGRAMSGVLANFGVSS